MSHGREIDSEVSEQRLEGGRKGRMAGIIRTGMKTAGMGNQHDQRKERNKETGENGWNG